jgi:tRNA-2-methylthio-N6-dimethylallyladenosine synthase
MTYYIITIGCQMNKADSEKIKTFLEINNYREKIDYLKTDLVIINTCGVRQTAEDRVYGLVKEVRKKNKKAHLIITGCLAKREDVKRRLKGQVNLFLPINQLPDLFNLLENKKYLSQFDKERLVSGEKYLSIKTKHQTDFSAFVPIGNGCNNFCSYCVVPYARGKEVYRKESEIIQEVRELINKDYKEIILLAQNVNSYPNFPKLLETLAKIKGDFWLRFSSSHPKDLSDKLIETIAKHQKIANHLHLALQSGDNQILKKMNRNYTLKDYTSIIEKLRKKRANISITTDIIVGFPGETKKQFQNTLKAMEKIKFDMAYISKYSKRPGTVAYKLKDNLNLEEKKAREKLLTNLLRKTALLNNKRYLNKEIRVLIDNINRKGKLQGKTSSYKTVLIDNSKNKKLIGQFKTVKITEVKEFNLLGEII